MPPAASRGRTAYASRAWRQLCEDAYRRYGYWCYWCNHPINPALPPTHRMSRTVDHLRAVSLYGIGLPSLDDVRPMHRACNAERGAGRRVRRTVARRRVVAAAPSPHW